MAAYRIPQRRFILNLLVNCRETEEGLNAWREGEATFEQAMMMAVHRLILANEELRRKLDYACTAR